MEIDFVILRFKGHLKWAHISKKVKYKSVCKIHTSKQFATYSKAAASNVDLCQLSEADLYPARRRSATEIGDVRAFATQQTCYR